jgi:phosphoserine/homoserine phosphotransferase
MVAGQERFLEDRDCPHVGQLGKLPRRESDGKKRRVYKGIRRKHKSRFAFNGSEYILSLLQLAQGAEALFSKFPMSGAGMQSVPGADDGCVPSSEFSCNRPTLFQSGKSQMKQTVIVLDLEGVLVPEIWISVAEKTKISELRRTTRDEPDYDKLMRGRIRILDDRGLKLADIQEVIAAMQPLEGALDFIRELRSLSQVIILSDTFEEFAKPVMRSLEWPTIFCNQLIVEEGHILGYKLRQANPKRSAVAALRSLNYFVIGAGDSFNDTDMLAEADVGFLFRSPAHIKKQFPRFKPYETYSDLLAAIKKAMAQIHPPPTDSLALAEL